MRTLDAGICTLEPQVEAHASAMFVVLSDPAIYEFEGEPPPSVDALAAGYRRKESRRSPDGSEIWLNWVVREPGGALTGYVQATVTNRGCAYVGYEFCSRYWRRGIATAALAAVLRELSSEYAVRQFVAVLKKANHRSLGLLRKLGFSLAPAEQWARFEPEADEAVMLASCTQWNDAMHQPAPPPSLRFRALEAADQDKLWHWLHVALWDPPPAPLRPIEVLRSPAVRIYAEHWGRASDVGVVALVDGTDAGACWMRLLPPGVGLGSGDATTPQLGIALEPRFQRRGHGQPLMREALAAARRAGYRQVSLTVHPDNPAQFMYERCGFRKVERRNGYHLMVARLASHADGEPVSQRAGDEERGA